MNTLATLKPIAQAFLFASLATLLSSCGFLTAPLGLAGAGVASAGVRAADFGLTGTEKAASYVQESSVKGYHVTSDFIRKSSVQGYYGTSELLLNSFEYLFAVPPDPQAAESLEAVESLDTDDAIEEEAAAAELVQQ
jgi:hypothetical protein